MPKTATFPKQPDVDSIKLQKYISDCGVMSRRAAEKAISDGKIRVNGVVARLGDRILPGKDTIECFGAPVLPACDKITVALNKPRGYVTTMSDEKGRKTVADLLASAGTRLYPAGRLDCDSHGLIICTNDGELANRLMHPSHHFKKVYLVTVNGCVDENIIKGLCDMRTLDGESIMPVKATAIYRNDKKTVIKFVLMQGKNRQIRRMCACFGLDIAELKRIAVGPIVLGDLPTGEYRVLTPDELIALERIK